MSLNLKMNLAGCARAFFIGALLLTSCSSDGSNDTPEPDKGKENTESTTGIDKFSNDNIYSRNTFLRSDYAMQTFSIGSDGSIWYTQSGENNDKQRHQLNLVHAQPNKGTNVMTAQSEVMILEYFGHGTNTDVQEVGNDRYFWLGAYGSANSKGQYWTERLVARVKYEKGKTKKTNEADDYFYIGDYTDMHPAVDSDNDILTINYADPKNSTRRSFVMYKLSDALKAPKKTFPIVCTDGHASNNPLSTNKITVNVSCRDLTTLTPLAKMSFAKQGYGESGAIYYDWQGFDVYKDKLYYFEGQSNYNLNNSNDPNQEFSHAYVTIFDFKGKIVEKRTKVAFVSDRKILKDIGVSEWGALEAEGVKIHKGKMYLGFTARGLTNDNPKHYQNIFVFDQSKK